MFKVFALPSVSGDTGINIASVAHGDDYFYGARTSCRSLGGGRRELASTSHSRALLELDKLSPWSLHYSKLPTP